MTTVEAKPDLLHPDLEALRQEFAAIRADAERLVEGLTVETFNWRPSPEKWSIAQCVTHLSVVDGKDIPLLEEAMDKARRERVTGEGPYRYGPIAAWFIGKIEPPSKMKAKAPAIYVPPPVQDPGVAMAEFRRLQTRMAELVREANGLDLGRVKVASPVATFLRFSLGQRFRLIAAHDRRHLHQAWQVRRALP